MPRAAPAAGGGGGGPEARLGGEQLQRLVVTAAAQVGHLERHGHVEGAVQAAEDGRVGAAAERHFLAVGESESGALPPADEE